MDNRQITIIFPLYNDWPSLELVLEHLERTLPRESTVTYVVVNDKSLVSIPENFGFSLTVGSLIVLHLKKNVGHQAAIAIGLDWVVKNIPDTLITIMDSDGEDNPEAVPLLVESAKEHGNAIVVAQRTKRSESFLFKCGYMLYKWGFHIATGKNIRFGNFSAFSSSVGKELLQFPELWWHFAGTVLHSKKRVLELPVARATRYAGKSTMNVGSLVVHGIRAMAVFMDIVVTRLAIFFFLVGFLATAGIASVIGLRLLTNLAIPGWASYVVLSLIVVFMQSALMFLFLFMITLLMSPFRSSVAYAEVIDRVEKRG